VLSISDSPWLVKLLYSFQDPRYLYLAMVLEATGTGRSRANGPNVTRRPPLGLARTTRNMCPAATCARCCTSLVRAAALRTQVSARTSLIFP